MMWNRISLACLLTLSCACASGPKSPNVGTVAPHELLAGAPLSRVPDAPDLVENDGVLAVSAEMGRFLDSNVHRKASSQVKLRALIDAIIYEGNFGLEFEGATRTASEMFRLRRGNCLSFSNMFIAMARYVGLEAVYQEVDIPPDWAFQNDVFLLNRHVNVSVDLGSLGPHVVDFNIDDFKSSYDLRKISDSRARAHYFNNMGVESMQAGDTASALGYFRKAIAENDRQFSPAWTNLGTLYSRNGHPAYAEAAYLLALKVDDEDLVAMSNLAGFYGQQGDEERAAIYRKSVMDHRKENPYLRYQRARDAYTAEDYGAAISHLKYAIRKKKNEDEFYFLLGMCYLQKGDERAAKRWLARAEEVAATDALKRRYSSKLELLMSGMK
jgi:Flp pilus assembly protein TadD